MISTVVGRLLYTARKEKHVTQEEVCHGVCNRTTVARIESGIIMPSLKQMEVFFTRLGEPIPNNIVPVTKADKIRFNLEEKMLCMFDSRDLKRLEILNEYKNCHHTWGKLEEQFFLLQQGTYVSQFDECLQESIEIFEKALKLTNPDFSVIKEIPDCLFSIKELNLINSIAHSEYYLYDLHKKDIDSKNRAINRMQFLKSYFEKHFKNYESWGMYSVIIFNLTNWVGLDGKIEEALDLSEKALRYRTSFHYFTRHLYNYGYSLAALGNLKKAERFLIYALTLNKLFDNHNDVEKLLEDIKESFKLELSLD